METAHSKTTDLMKNSCKHTVRLCGLLAILAIPTLAHSQNAMELWVHRYSRGYATIGAAVAISTNGNPVCAVGDLSTTGNGNYVVIQYAGTSGTGLSWTNYYNGPANKADISGHILVGKNGAVIVSGISQASLSPPVSYDIATVAYSALGTPLWTNRAPATSNHDEQLAAMVADNSGDVYLTGSSVPPSAPSDSDFVTTKLSGANGTVLWTKYFGREAGSLDMPWSVAVDSQGGVCVTGSGQRFSDNTFYYATIKYSGSGIPLWTNYCDLGSRGGLNGSPAKVVFDANDDVIIAGCSPDGASGVHYRVLKLDGSEGLQLWTTNYHNNMVSAEHRVTGLAVDSNGTIYVTGTSRGNFSGLDYATLALTGGGGWRLWEQRYNGPASGDDQANAIALDPAGNVVVTGGSPGVGTTNDYATICYSSSNGLPLWTNRYARSGDDIARALGINSIGEVFVTGQSIGSGGYYDSVTVKYGPPPAGWDYTYFTNAGNIFISGYTGSNSAIVIPERINNLPVAHVVPSAFAQKTHLASVTFPNGLLSLGDSALKGCISLTNVVFGANLQTIGNSAFQDCTNLNSISVPDSLVTLGRFAFSSCKALSSVTLGNGLASIQENTFSGCTSLTNVTIPPGVTTILPYAFTGCSNLPSVQLPGVISIGSYAFAHCTRLRNLGFSDRLSIIGEAAFWDCSLVTSVTIPASVSTVQPGAFNACHALTSVWFKGNRPSQIWANAFPQTSTVLYYLPGATGWAAWPGPPPAVLWNPSIAVSDVASGGLDISGSADIPLVLEVSRSLSYPSWVTLLSCSLTNGHRHFVDPDWDKHDSGFYRIRSP